MSDFMQTILSSELKPVISDAIPILHRLLLRMGSFPYQNDPMSFLNFEILRIACAYINNDIYNIHDNLDFQVIFFQSLGSFNRISRLRNNTEHTPRDKDDDEHLEHALWCVERRSRSHYNPAMVFRGQPNPPPSHFPSSWSRKLDQPIPTGESRSFLRLMLVLNLDSTGFDISSLAAWSQQAEEVVDCMLAAFRPGPEGISWDYFVEALADMVCDSYSCVLTGRIVANSLQRTLLRGFAQLLGPLLWNELFEGDAVPSDMRQAVYKQHVRFARRKVLPSAYILNPPVLSQLDIMLPPIIIQNISISWSTRETHTDFSSLESHIQEQKTPTILLVSGRNQNQQRILAGIFDGKKYPYKISEKPFMFQLAPLHRIYRPLPSEAEDFMVLGHSEDSTMDMLRYQSGKACLFFSENSGHFSVQDDPALDEEFHVDAVEIYQCDIEKEAEHGIFDRDT